MVPRRPFLIMSPVRSTEVGSPTMHQSSRSPRLCSSRQTITVPSLAGPSSSLVSRKAMSIGGLGFAARNSSQATTMAASEVFMSLAPRPKSLPSRCEGTKGSLPQASSGPVGTTSVWPAQTRVGCWPVPRRAQRLVTRKSAGPLSMVSQTKPSARRRSAIRAWQPSSSGVTEGRAINSSVRRRVAVIRI
ncbi:hypothetical protein D9M68_809530 [compost metagenome]